MSSSEYDPTGQQAEVDALARKKLKEIEEAKAKAATKLAEEKNAVTNAGIDRANQQEAKIIAEAKAFYLKEGVNAQWPTGKLNPAAIEEGRFRAWQQLKAGADASYALWEAQQTKIKSGEIYFGRKKEIDEFGGVAKTEAQAQKLADKQRGLFLTSENVMIIAEQEPESILGQYYAPKIQRYIPDSESILEEYGTGYDIKKVKKFVENPANVEKWEDIKLDEYEGAIKYEIDPEWYILREYGNPLAPKYIKNELSTGYGVGGEYDMAPAKLPNRKSVFSLGVLGSIAGTPTIEVDTIKILKDVMKGRRDMRDDLISGKVQIGNPDLKSLGMGRATSDTLKTFQDEFLPRETEFDKG